MHEHGRPVRRSWRLVTAMVGRVQWELIEPLDDESDYARFLADKGGGVHHIAVAPTNFDQALAVVPEDVGSSGPPWRLSAVKGSSVPRRQPDEASR